MKSAKLCECGCGQFTNLSTYVNKEKGVKKGQPLRFLAAHHLKIALLKHGQTGTPTFNCWTEMRKRCSNRNSVSWPRYGGRGITICERWKSFKNFLDDMGERPSSEHSIDRINNDGNYEPANCRWATRSEQAKNRGNARKISAMGFCLTITEWSEKSGLLRETIVSRLNAGWPIEVAVSKPSHRAALRARNLEHGR